MSVLAPASYAQARIWLDEKIRFNPHSPQVAIYNMPFLYRLSPNHTLSIKQLCHALRLTINKHQSLRTSLVFNTETNLLMQRIIDLNNTNYSNEHFKFIETIFKTVKQLNNIMHDEKQNSQLFDLAKGLVFRCHLVYHKQIPSNDLLSHEDAIIFNFHHAVFDSSSMNVFLHDVNQAYITGQLPTNDDTDLSYLDCKYQIYIFHHFSYRHFLLYII